MRRALAALSVLFALVLGCGPAATPASPDAPQRASGSPAAVSVAFASRIRAVDLPPEGRETLRLVRAGGPFASSHDGVVFENREHRLPPKTHGWYREYAVKTPGAADRGARRIVAGAGGEAYWTDDHYATFRRIEE